MAAPVLPGQGVVSAALPAKAMQPLTPAMQQQINARHAIIAMPEAGHADRRRASAASVSSSSSIRPAILSRAALAVSCSVMPKTLRWNKPWQQVPT